MWASVQRLHRLRSVGALAAVLALGTAAPASAEDVSIADGTLAVRAAPGEHNALLIQPDSLGSYQVYDDGAPVTPGAGCTALAKHGVRCSGPVLGVSVDAGDGDDVVGAWAVSIPMTVSGGDGDDLVDSGTASDRVTGDAGLDTVVAGAGDDSVSGGDGGDMLEGGDGTDTISGDGGDDIARAGDGSQEVVSGGAGRDLLDGGPGDDTVSGDAGDDAIAGGSGSDTLSTGSGKDSVYVGNQTSDDIHCQQGDEVHAPASEVPPGCTGLAPSSHLPDSWPPKTTATKPTAQ